MRIKSFEIAHLSMGSITEQGCSIVVLTLTNCEVHGVGRNKNWSLKNKNVVINTSRLI
jgi:hypothetical protein